MSKKDVVEENVYEVELVQDGEEVMAEDVQATEEVEEDLNWREAGKVLKTLVEKYKEDFTIDSYFVKIKVDELRARYNDKERSAGLHAEIISLSV